MTTLPIPESVDALMALPDGDKTLLAATVASGFEQSAFYQTVNGRTYTLARQVSLDKDHPPDFALTPEKNSPEGAMFTVHDAAGTTVGAIVFQHSPRNPKFSKEFIERYATDPEANIDAKLRLADYILREFGDTLNPNAKVTQQISARRRDEPGWRTNYLLGLNDRLHATYDTGFAHNDLCDQPSHVRGFQSIVQMTMGKLNETAVKHGREPIFSDPLKQKMRVLSELHDIKTHMPSQYLRPWRDKLTPEDAAKGPVERQNILALKKELFDRGNHNHPAMGLMLLAHVPDEAKASQLHHLSLFRDQPPAERAKYVSWNLMKNDVDEKNLPYIARMLFIPEVADAVISNESKSPVAMLDALYEKTKWANHLRMPMVDPDMLGFMLKHNILDDYIESKRRPSRAIPGQHESLVLDDAYVQRKKQILTELNYEQNRDAIEKRLVDRMLAEPLVQQSLTQGRERVA